MYYAVILIVLVICGNGGQALADDNSILQRQSATGTDSPPVSHFGNRPSVPIVTDLLSPKCDEERLRELLGTALVAIAKQENKSVRIYTVTIDITLMSLPGVTKTMFDAGCF